MSEAVYVDNTWVELSSEQRLSLELQYNAQASLALGADAHTAGLHHRGAEFFPVADTTAPHEPVAYNIVHWPNPYERDARCAIVAPSSNSNRGAFLVQRYEREVFSVEGLYFDDSKGYYGRQEIVVDKDDSAQSKFAWACLQFLQQGGERHRSGETDSILVPALGGISMAGIRSSEVGRLTLAINSYAAGAAATSATEVMPLRPGTTSYKLADALVSHINPTDTDSEDQQVLLLSDAQGRRTGVSFAYPDGFVAIRHTNHFPHVITMDITGKLLPEEPMTFIRRYHILEQGVVMNFSNIAPEVSGLIGLNQAVATAQSQTTIGRPDFGGDPIILEDGELQAFNELLLGLMKERVAADV
jgi:hypothetical protein